MEMASLLPASPGVHGPVVDFDPPGEERADGFVKGEDEDGSSEAGSEESSNAPSLRTNLKPWICVATVFYAAGLAASLVAVFLARQRSVSHPPLLAAIPGQGGAGSCKSGEFWMESTKLLPYAPGKAGGRPSAGLRLCLADPLRWEAAPPGGECPDGGLRVSLQEGGTILAGVLEAVFKSARLKNSEGIMPGQFLSLTPQGVAPFQPLEQVIFSRDARFPCKEALALDVGQSLFVALCQGGEALPQPGTLPPLTIRGETAGTGWEGAEVRVCRATVGGAVECGDAERLG
ncbi:hypothetical protein T484DRAFT_1915702, partial [Baffinella frigidus]